MSLSGLLVLAVCLEPPDGVCAVWPFCFWPSPLPATWLAKSSHLISQSTNQYSFPTILTYFSFSGKAREQRDCLWHENSIVAGLFERRYISLASVHQKFPHNRRMFSPFNNDSEHTARLPLHRVTLQRLGCKLIGPHGLCQTQNVGISSFGSGKTFVVDASYSPWIAHICTIHAAACISCSHTVVFTYHLWFTGSAHTGMEGLLPKFVFYFITTPLTVCIQVVRRKYWIIFIMHSVLHYVLNHTTYVHYTVCILYHRMYYTMNSMYTIVCTVCMYVRI